MYKPFLLISLASLPLLAQGGCPDSLPQSGKKVFCYYEGKKSPRSIDPCPCSHLLYKNVPIDADSRVRLSNQLSSDLEILRSKKPDLHVLLSIGGESVDSDTFRAIVSRKDQLTNFTESLNSLYQDKTIQGIELDWEWPLDSGDKKDKIKLIRYIRQLKLATGDENIRRRIVRSADQEDEETEITTFDSRMEISEATTILTTNAEEEHINLEEEEAMEEAGVTTEWSPARSSWMTESPESESEMETTTENRRRRGYVSKKRVKSARRQPSEAPETTTEAERNSLEDVLFSDQDNFLEPDIYEDKFLVVLRLSPRPEQLVKGYEFKMLNKFVDLYTLNTQNLSTKYLNSTFHHSRLMGASDIYNSDAIVDVVQGLGVPVSRLILNTPAIGLSFSLMDKTVNLPGAATTGLPSTVTYQQVCQLLSVGNWTLERDEDLTGPYAFLGNKWIAFDDDTSLKIKAKYVLLRDLAGVGLMSVDADDIDNVCGKGRQSLLHTLSSVMTSLQRKPRQLIVTSLEEDLLATAQNFIPVSQANGLRVSPFRIVRIVDREGQIQSIRQNAETVLECSRQGYYRHPEDCSRFYRCVKFNQYENDYTIFEYGCPEGLVFDDRWEVCVWPAQATPCDGSSEIFPIPKEDYKCPGPGFFVDPENCRWFFACLDHLGDGTYTHYEFRCPFGLAFDEANLRCDWPWLVPACGNVGVGPAYAGAGPALPSRAEFAKSFNPIGAGVNNSPFPSVQSIPSFESSRTANPPFRRGKAFDDNVARDSCENCQSPVLTITGRGQVNNKGLEVAGDIGHRLRQPKAQQFPSTTALPSYGSTEGYDQGYNYPVPASPLPLALVPTSTTAAPPSYNPSSPGYNYPVPANPLPIGISVSNPGEAGLLPALAPITPNIPAYGAPLVNSSPLPSYGSPSSTPGYASPLSSTYAPPVISTSYAPAPPRTPEPSYALLQDYGVPAAPVIPAEEYGLPLAQPLEEYGVPAAPLVVSIPAPAYQPYSTYGPPAYEQPSEEYGVPIAPLIEDYGVPSAPVAEYGVPLAPLVSTTYAPRVPVTTPAYRPAYKPVQEYGVPAAPLVEDYGVPAAPLVEEYGVPLAPLVSTTYAPPVPVTTPAYRPSSTIKPFVHTNNRPAYKPVQDYAPIVSSPRPPYQPPVEPLEEYGLPLAQPLDTYGVPTAPLVEDYGVPAAPLVEDYGIPAAPLVEYIPAPLVTTVRPAYAPPVTTPAPSYGPSTPLTSFVHTGRPVYSPRPTSYQPVLSSTFAPPVAAPAESYGVPLADPVTQDEFYDQSLAQGYEEPLETYGVPAAPVVSTTYAPPVVSSTYRPAPTPATLPDSWPQYPSDLPTPPEITYGGFKPPSPAPSKYSPKPSYQQPSYGPTKPDISYGGFKALSKAPLTPNIPAYGPPKVPSSGYAYPAPANPLVLPTRKPAYPTTPAPVFVSTTPAYVEELPSYGGSPSPSPGYSYPVPANPLSLPTRTGKSHQDKTPQVGSVIPLGFSSATLSNGPFSSGSRDNNNFGQESRRPKAFDNNNAAGNSVAGDFNGGNRGGGSNFRPSGVSSSGNKKQNLQSFVNFGSDGSDEGRQGSSRPSAGRGNNFGGAGPASSGSGRGFGQEGRGGRQQDDIRPAPGVRFNGATNGVRPTGGSRGPGFNDGPSSRPSSSFGSSTSSRSNSRPTGNRFSSNNNFGGGNGQNAINRPSEARPSNNRPSGLGGRSNNRPSGSSNNRPSGFGGNSNNRPSGARGNSNNRPSGFGGNSDNRPSGSSNNRPSGFGGNPNNRPSGFGGNVNNSPSGFGRNSNIRPSGLGGNSNNRPSEFGGNSNNRPSGFGGNSNNRPSGFGGNFNERPRNNGPVDTRRPAGSSNRPSGLRPNRPNSRPSGLGSSSPASSLISSSGSGSPSRGRPQSGLRPSASISDEPRRGKQLGGGLGVTAVSRPSQNRPAVLGKLDPSGHSAVNNWDSGTWEKFGPGGFRTFNETLGPEVCQRPGLFRHPKDCTQFYECYWDKWIEKFTLHIFPCPVAMAVRQYDESISACNWPFLGPNCEGGNYY